MAVDKSMTLKEAVSRYLKDGDIIYSKLFRRGI